MQERLSAGERGVLSRRWLLISACLLLLLSSVVNVLLAAKARQLRAVISTIKSEAGLKRGTRVPAIVAEDLNGVRTEVRFEESDRPTLLYVFSPSCGWCRRNEDSFSSLINQTRGRFRPIGISLSREGLADYAKNNFQGLPVYSNLEPSTTVAYKFSGTPETILVGNDGAVMRVWNGAYSGETLLDIEGYFGIKLPALRESK